MKGARYIQVKVGSFLNPIATSKVIRPPLESQAIRESQIFSSCRKSIGWVKICPQGARSFKGQEPWQKSLFSWTLPAEIPRPIVNNFSF